ncbi:MAG: glycine/sarcosine/betaine reductase complex component C subunit beta, partial [Candidatus Rokuibacteriota bacterium]
MPVIRAVSLVLAHVPSLVRLGSKPLRVLREVDRPIEYLRPHLRDWDAARTYAPNQVFIGNVGVDELAAQPTPWHRHPIGAAPRFGPDGEIMPEDELFG